MMQFRERPAPPVGILYLTTMSRPDSALALSLLYGYEGKREGRASAIAVSKAGLAAAEFCNAVWRFYAGAGPIPNSNSVFPVGLAANGPMPEDLPMVKTVVERRTDKGELQYPRTVESIGDTSEIAALIRNALTTEAKGNCVIVLSAPATELARALALPGVRDQVVAKVKLLIVVQGPQDAAAAQKVLADWPTPVVLCGKDVGEALLFPGSSIDTDFAWSPAHPVVDAYRAFQPMPYDAPSWDMAAILHGLRPAENFFTLSDSGTIQASESGFSFTPGAGTHRHLLVDPAKKEAILKKYVEIVSAKPVPRRQFQRPPAAVAPPKPPDKPVDSKAAETKPATP